MVKSDRSEIIIIVIATIIVLEGLSPERKTKCARGNKKISLFATIGGTFVPDWPNLSICSLVEGDPARIGADPIFRSAYCAGYCRDNGAKWAEVEMCRRIFIENRRRATSSQFSRCTREIWSALDRIFEDLCVTALCVLLLSNFWGCGIFKDTFASLLDSPY